VGARLCAVGEGETNAARAHLSNFCFTSDFHRGDFYCTFSFELWQVDPGIPNGGFLGKPGMRNQVLNNTLSIKHISDPPTACPLHFRLRQKPGEAHNCPDYITMRSEKESNIYLVTQLT
jgi:hypothetical protein